MQTQLDDASKQSQEAKKSRSQEKTKVAKSPRSLADWTTSEQYEQIRELKTNNIELQGSLDQTVNESLVERLTQQDTVNVLHAGAECEVSGRTFKSSSEPQQCP